MKRLLLIWLFSGSLDGFSQLPDTTIPLREYNWSAPKQTVRYDTLCEYMHLSIRPNGFVIARKALSVRVNGICVKHLQSNGRPFPVHYKVGWCEGREGVWNRLVKLLNER